MKKTAESENGQAMVEFVIMLVIFMTLIAGQIYVARLLMFDHWAQQEARFMAYEQTETPAAAGRSPTSDLENSGLLHRPSIIDRLDVERRTIAEEEIRDLILSRRLPLSDDTAVAQGDVYYAQRESDGFSLVPMAYARQDSQPRRSSGYPRSQIRLFQDERIPNSTLDDRIQLLIEKAGIGDTVCKIGAAKFGKAGYRPVQALFASAECASAMDRGFAVHLAQNLDFKELTRDFSDRLHFGDLPANALTESVGDAVARGYYSFFDQVVQVSANQALTTGATALHALEVNGTMISDDQFQNILFSLRYVGSLVAESSIQAALLSIGFLSTVNRDPQVEKDFAESMNSVLHENGKDTLGGIGYMLGPDYLPFTSLMLEPMYGSILNAVMENVLSKDGSLEDSLMYESNKKVEVEYDSGNGLFPAATRRFATSNRKLAARHYLVTQSWNIPRRESPTGPYRQLGNEDDDYDGDSDEAILKRRVVGLWLIPSDPVAFIAPLADLVDSSGTIGGLFNENVVLEGFSDGIELLSSGAKDFICNNPLSDFMDWLEALPGFDSSPATLPACPAVRPGAYPFTKEIVDDELSGKKRDFNDFVTEQKRNNPRARPQYHEDADTATNGGGQDDQGAQACNWTD